MPARKTDKDPLDAVALAALELAAARGWAALDMAALAAVAGLSLAELRVLAGDRVEAVAAAMRMIDRQVLERVGAPDEALPPRERIFDVFMERFEAMEAHRPGIVAIMEGVARCPAAAARLAPEVGRSVAWMLTAAGATRPGCRGALLHVGAVAVWARAAHAWRGDAGPDLPRTMAALDQALRRARLLTKE